jgi:Zn-dependent alcohol dehydrogenase
MTKSWWMSKTIWVNIVALIAAILTTLGIVDLTPDVQAQIVVFVMGAVNIGLRVITKDKVGL